MLRPLKEEQQQQLGKMQIFKKIVVLFNFLPSGIVIVYKASS